MDGSDRAIEASLRNLKYTDRAMEASMENLKPDNDADRAMKASLENLKQDNDLYIERPNSVNGAKLVTSMNKHATMLTGAGRHQQARGITRTKTNFTNAGSIRKKHAIAVNLKKSLVRSPRQLCS